MKVKPGAVLGFITVSAAFLVFFSATRAQAAYELMDGKLIISGFIKNTTYIRTSVYDREFETKYPDSNHDSRVDFSNWSGYLEALYSVKESSDLTVRLFGGLRYWYEMSMRLDDELRRSVYHEHRKEYISPRQLEDVITEAYVDIIRGPWQVRIGKQIAIWGQLDVNRVADVVNPLDLRWGVPGVDNWEEIKRGIWMIRAFYQSQLPGSLSFEFIFNPGDYKGMMLPYTGTHWGQEYFKDAGFTDGMKERGMFAWLHEKMIQDQPGWNLSENYEFGMRVRGFTWNIDWTLLYWNGLTDGPVCAHPSRANDLALQYVKAGIRAAMTGGYLDPGPVPRYEVFEYKRFHTIGGTAQTFISWLYNSVWRLEWFYEIGSPMNKGEVGDGTAIYDEVRRDIFGFALQGNWKIRLPWFTEKIATGKMLDLSITYFREQIFNHDHDLVVNDRYHPLGDSVTDSFTLFMKQEMFNTSWVFIFIGNYYMRCGKWMAVPSFTYMFPEYIMDGGLRLDLGLKLYGGARHHYDTLSHLMDHKDSIIFRLRWEF